MKIFCRTNLDAYQREEWPEEFTRIPLVGEHIQAKSGRVLKVVRVIHMTHRYKGVDDKWYEVPAIDLELHT